MKKIKTLSVSAMLFAFPAVAFAQINGINDLIDQVQVIIARLIPVVIGLAVLVFIWGVLRYVLAGGEETKDEAKKFMLWGIIGLFVMVSVWGLVNILSRTIFSGERINEPPTVPMIPTTQAR